MFVEMTMAGLKRTVTEIQARALEAMGWTKVLGASQDNDAGKKDAPSQKSPTTKRKAK